MNPGLSGVTKRIYLEARQCLRRGWYARNLPEERLSEAEQFLIDEGIEIGSRAHQRYPGGVLVESRGLSGATAKTRQLMNNPCVPAIFEATFHIDGYTTKADVLPRNGNGWRVVEVKSSLFKPKVDDDLIDDVCYTVMVATRCGVNVNAASLLQIRPEFRRDSGIDEMFGETDVLAAVQERMPAFSSGWNEIPDATGRSEPPDPTPGRACGSCPYYEEHCLGKGIENPVLDLPRIGGKLTAFFEAGMLDLRDVPDDLAATLTENQRVVLECARTRQPYVSPDLRDSLADVRWPAYYLDFETVSTPLPLYADVAPHALLPTQYSIHRCTAPGAVDNHFEYLADPQRDCRRELAERLIADLGTEGSVIVYSGFEKGRIGELIERFPDLAEPLSAIRERLFDLLAVVRKHYCHPDFHGSYSIKTVLPVVVPEMTYDGLEIAEGQTASVKFAKMARGQYSPTECEAIRRNLLTYCGQDTLAMVKLHKALWELSQAGAPGAQAEENPETTNRPERGAAELGPLFDGDEELLDRLPEEADARGETWGDGEFDPHNWTPPDSEYLRSYKSSGSPKDKND
jgi:hypothetical protein